MLPFGVTIPATVPQGPEIPEGLMNNPVLPCITLRKNVIFGLKAVRQENWHRDSKSDLLNLKQKKKVYL
jgi:hypothetical protein